MNLALNNLQMFFMPLNKETKPNQYISFNNDLVVTFDALKITLYWLLYTIIIITVLYRFNLSN